MDLGGECRGGRAQCWASRATYGVSTVIQHSPPAGSGEGARAAPSLLRHHAATQLGEAVTLWVPLHGVAGRNAIWEHSTVMAASPWAMPPCLGLSAMALPLQLEELSGARSGSCSHATAATLAWPPGAAGPAVQPEIQWDGSVQRASCRVYGKGRSLHFEQPQALRQEHHYSKGRPASSMLPFNGRLSVSLWEGEVTVEGVECPGTSSQPQALLDIAGYPQHNGRAARGCAQWTLGLSSRPRLCSHLSTTSLPSALHNRHGRNACPITAQGCPLLYACPIGPRELALRAQAWSTPISKSC